MRAKSSLETYLPESKHCETASGVAFWDTDDRIAKSYLDGGALVAGVQTALDILASSACANSPFDCAVKHIRHGCLAALHAPNGTGRGDFLQPREDSMIVRKWKRVSLLQAIVA